MHALELPVPVQLGAVAVADSTLSLYGLIKNGNPPKEQLISLAYGASYHDSLAIPSRFFGYVITILTFNGRATIALRAVLLDW